MTLSLRPWTALGLGTVFALGACDVPPPPSTTAETAPSEAALPEPAAVTPVVSEPAGSQQGEGEGGVAIALAATDPVVFNAALAIAAAHVIAARDAYALGETDAAAEMFAHPVSEVLFDMAEVFEARGVADFDDLFTETAAAALAGETPEQIAARTDAILARLQDASGYAPDNGTSKTGIALGVVLDQVERANAMYRAAKESGAYEPYLDGYGFFKAAQGEFNLHAKALKVSDPDAFAAARAALTTLAAAYPDAGRQTSLTADVSAMAVTASELAIVVAR